MKARPSSALSEAVEAPTVTEAQSTPRVFRRDVEGLRAVAIALVAVFHIWIGSVSGGVDVFLLISGYFVAGSLIRRFVRGDLPALGQYLLRLARRLLPALITVITAVVVATLLFLPRTTWLDISAQSIASLGYFENWWLALSGLEYGAASADVSPLQHIWSLSIQGQLFVGVPVVLLLIFLPLRKTTARTRAIVVWSLVGTATAASFVYAALTTGGANQTFAYYDTAARAWQYLLGALVAGVAVRLPRVLAFVVGWGGLALLIAAGFLVDGRASFPGPAALVPLGAAVAILLAGTVPTKFGVDRLLGSRAMSGLGKYSYTFYLWHWPILIFVVAVTERDAIGWRTGTAILLASAVLSFLTHHLVEKPIRNAPRFTKTVWPRVGRAFAMGGVAIAGVTVLVVSAGFQGYVQQTRAATYASALDPLTHPGAMSILDPLAYPVTSADLIPAPLNAEADKVRALADGCITGGGFVGLEVCDWGDVDSDITIALVGGSHTEVWLDALDAIGKQRGVKVQSYLRWGCTFFETFDGVEDVAQDPRCVEWNQDAMAELLDSKPSLVITTGTRPTLDDSIPQMEYIPGGYVSAWETLEDAGIGVLVIRDAPWITFGEDPLECLDVLGANAAECAVDRSLVLDEVAPDLGLAAPTVEFPMIDFTDLLCPDGACRFAIGNVTVYRDRTHLTASYISTMTAVLEERMAQAGVWDRLGVS